MDRRTFLQVGVLVIANVLHPTLVKTSLSIFACSTPVLGKSFLLADSNIICGSAEHNALLPLFVIPLGVYGLGIPIAIATLLYLNKDCLDLEITRRRLGFIYSNVGLGAD